MIEKLKGSFPAIATPLDGDERVDGKALRKLVNKVMDAGVDGVLVLGTAGEGPVIETKEKYRAIEIAVDEMNGRGLVIAGTGDISTKTVKENNRQAAKLGADAALVVPPFYFGQNQIAVADFFKDISQEGSLPVMIYNIPMTTKIYVEPDTIATLAQEEGVIGIKDSSRNFNNFQTVIGLQSQKFTVFQGIAPLMLASLLLGANGSISPVPNVAPHLEIGLHKAVKEGNIEKAKVFQAEIKKVVSLWNYGGPITTILKAILNMQGIGEYIPVRPNPILNEEELKILRQKVEKLNLL